MVTFKEVCVFVRNHLAPEPAVVSFSERLCLLVHISGILALGLMLLVV